MTASVLVEPAYLTHPEYSRTLGPEVADLAALAGFTPDAEQRLVLDAMFALGPDDLPLTLEVGVCVGRQNLKTGVLKMAALGKLFLLDQRLVVWSAHEFNTSAEAFRDLKDLIDGCSYLSRRVRSIRAGHGDEAIELAGGQRLIFKTRTKGGGRGISGDTVFLDEAMFLQPMHMGALIPTLSARPEPQVVYAGSPGLAESAVWRAVRNRGRAGDVSLVWVEWCDDQPGACAAPQCTHQISMVGCRLDDETRWARANPALGKRITTGFVRGERRALPPAEFARERLGWWDDPDADAEQLLSDWVACADPDSAPDSQPVYAVDVSPGARSASIVAALWRDDDLPHIEVVDHRPGTGWVAERCAELDERHDPREWVLDPAGPAGALLPDLEACGLAVRQLSSRELGQACAAFGAAVGDREVRHLADPLLHQAITAAGRRDIGDGLWAWSRRQSGADISPLYATTLALWALAELGPDDVTVISI